VTKPRDDALLPDYVDIPVLAGWQLRKMLAHIGISAYDLSRYVERSCGYVSKVWFPKQRLPLRASEALYTLVGHDPFWNAYSHTMRRDGVKDKEHDHDPG